MTDSIPQTLQEFWRLVVDVWQQGFMGIKIDQILLALLIFLIFALLRNLFARLTLNRLGKWASKTDTALDDRLLEALEPPLKFIPVIFGLFCALSYLDLKDDLALFSDKIMRSLVAFTLFWTLFRMAEPIATLLKRMEKIFTDAMVGWFVRVLRVAFTVIGAAAILEIWGIEVGPIIAGFGLLGVAVALGAQDLFKNLIAGLLVISERRFSTGDWIRVDGIVEGVVETVGFRSTVVRRFDKAPVYVPNAALSDNPVTNFSSMTHRRIYWVIGVEYKTTKEQLKEIRDKIESYVLNNDAFAKPPEVSTFVRIDKFNDSSIDLMLYCFTKTTVWGEWLEIKEALAYAIKDIVEAAGTGFAFPSQSLYVESLPETPDVFEPPTQKKK